jgi:foldase protein PrsA
MTRRRSRSVAIALVTLLVLAGVAATGCTNTTTTASSTAIATVNGVDIPTSAVDTQLAQLKKASPASFEGTAGAQVQEQYRAQILNSLIQLELIKQAAKSLGITVATDQVDAYVTQLQQQYGGAPALDAAMKTAGYTMASLRAQVTSNLLANAVSAKVASGTVSVTGAQISAYYDANKSQYSTPAQVHVEHILVATTATVLAQSLFSQVKSGGNFATLAKKYSTDPGSAAAGGDLGWAAPTSYVAPFAAAVEVMKVNEVRLVQSQYGWHVIKLLGRKAATAQTLAQATPAIKQALTQTAHSQQFSTYVAGLQRKANIQILDAALKKIIDANNAMSTTGSTATTSGQ